MAYVVLKHIHVLAVVLSFSGFFVRGLWMLADSPMLNRRWVKVAPHVNDSVLLVSALALAALIGQYPFVHGWLTAKVLGLLAYIGLGMFALRRGRSKALRVAFWLAALLIFGYIVSVALSKNPWGFLAA
ncbi:MAG: SirB2 family protein [Pseudomonadota bacterium]|jgi:uncharacterized membrane protein SirB2